LATFYGQGKFFPGKISFGTKNHSLRNFVNLTIMIELSDFYGVFVINNSKNKYILTLCQFNQEKKEDYLPPPSRTLKKEI